VGEFLQRNAMRQYVILLFVVAAIGSSVLITGDKLLGDSEQGLLLSRFNNTAVAGGISSKKVVQSLESIADCDESNCNMSSSMSLTGRLAPTAPGNYGFNITFDPPLPYPSPMAYARLWVNDHFLFPMDTTFSKWGKRAGGKAPLWIPLPPRALDADSRRIEHAGAANLTSYEFRLEYVCLDSNGCGQRTLSIRWATFDEAATPLSPFKPMPAAVLLPTQSAPEMQRRELATKLQSGWGTFYHPSMLTWVLLPESFAIKIGLFRLSTGTFLSPEGLTANPRTLHAFAIRAGLHSYDNAYIEASLTWRENGDNLNVSFATTVDRDDDSMLTMIASVNNPPSDGVNASDFLLMVVPNFTHGRAGQVYSDLKSITGVSAGLRKSTLNLLQGELAAPSAGSVDTAVECECALSAGSVDSDLDPYIA
jgi:hypothetical protein